ncbi:MAG: hypothetical protein OEY09_02315 [Gammaproteobacteria bacterium]|nr:hypothetical protein [Gammaproteobacteria bacterium]
MFEVNAILFLLLVEGFVILLLTLALIYVLKVRLQNHNKKAVAQLVSQVKRQSNLRLQETGSFLQEVYRLNDEELDNAVKEIDRQEKLFYGKIISLFLYSDSKQITALDASIAELISTYKALKPAPVTRENSEELDAALKELETLRADKEKLQKKFDETSKTLDGMVDEFGNMFGGGSNHQLDKGLVVEKIEVKK